MSNRSIKITSLIIYILTILIFVNVSSLSCTVFLVSDSINVFAGNNEDYKDTSTVVKYIPSSKDKFGRILFGFESAFPQGGMNEMGLFFDGLAISKLKVKQSINLPDYDGFLAEKALEECSTVEDVITLFKKYNLIWLENAQLMFGDRSGNSVIIEGDSMIVKTGDFQVATNFYQSQTPKDSITCERFLTSTEILEDSDTISRDLVRLILDKTHLEGKFKTVYSTIYDLKRNLVYVYHLHDFENEVVIDLKNDLGTKIRTVKINSLFHNGN
ncbi:MAG: linear amide C-N hydrolase [candidate division Zixibacteria bacterium]|nr:linear amide C-N hydrolase [candidate division Zixibacteria bacterium]